MADQGIFSLTYLYHAIKTIVVIPVQIVAVVYICWFSVKYWHIVFLAFYRFIVKNKNIDDQDQEEYYVDQEARPEYIKMCNDKFFLLSKAVSPTKKEGFKSLQALSESKMKLEIDTGAMMGVGADKYLEANGFEENTPLGAGKILQNEELCLHHGELKNSTWIEHYTQYGAATKLGVLILAKTVDNFRVWSKSNACLKEVKDIPNGRLFAYIEHTEEDEGGKQGYIVHLDAEKTTGSPTVSNGKGYILWNNGNYFHGDLKDCKFHGNGKLEMANGDMYEGEWRDGKKHGRGKMEITGTMKSCWDFVDFNLVHYEGNFKDGKMHGQGKMTVEIKKFITFEQNGIWENNEFLGEMHVFPFPTILILSRIDGMRQWISKKE